MTSFRVYLFHTKNHILVHYQNMTLSITIWTMHTTAMVLPWPYGVGALSKRLVHQGNIHLFGAICDETVVLLDLLEKPSFVYRQLSSETMAKLVTVYKDGQIKNKL